jgi:TRAP-type uncharacterized transport system substrate-binding protein
MNTLIHSVAALLLACAIPSLGMAQSLPNILPGVTGPKLSASESRASNKPRLTEQQHKDRINRWTLGLAAGRIEGAPSQFAAELARVLDDGDNMRVLPIITRGPFDNVYDLLYLRGVDAAILYGDVLDHFKSTPEFGSASKRINFLLSLFPSELHIFVRPEIKTLSDLTDKVVNFNTPGTAANFSGPIIFKQLGLNVKETFVPHSVAMGRMRKGPEVAATVWVSSKPLPPFLRGNWPEGFKFLPVPYSDKLEYYIPAQLDHADYPGLIPEGQRIATVAVPAVLAVYNWPERSERHNRLVRLVDYLFERFERLQTEAGYHPKWKAVNLAATVPGWQRFRPMQERLDKLGAARATGSLAGSSDGRSSSIAAKAQERLFNQFLEKEKMKQER